MSGRCWSVAKLLSALAVATIAGCGDSDRDAPHAGASVPPPAITKLPPRHFFKVNTHDVYAADRAGRLSAAVRHDPALVYVPNSQNGTVDVIDQRTYKVVDHFPTGALPQHVTPSWDMKRLWVDNDLGNSLTAINPRTSKPGKTLPVEDPYNLYFTVDGRYAIVVAERLQRLDFRDPQSMKLIKSVPTPCRGADHMDFTASGRYALVSCEFSGQMLELDVAHKRVVNAISVGGGPQDVKLSPDGRVFYVADMIKNGVDVIDSRRFRVIRFIRTGLGAHGLYASRDSRYLYVSNRG